MSVLLTLSEERKKCSFPRVAALLVVATDVRMLVINNSENKQSTTTYYLHAKLC